MRITCFKAPRTTQEARASQDTEVPIRAKRRGKNLPNAWDDVKRARQPRRKGRKGPKYRS